ncbi:MAG: CGNR zinc finger domain-containing protein [Actinomycetes bacterium]
MLFTHDTELALVEAAALVNTLSAGGDALADRAGLDAFLREFPYTGTVTGMPAELASVRELRGRLRRLWETTDRDRAAELVNEILADADARPYLSKHDAWDWHLHVTPPDAPLARRMGAEAAMAFLDLIRADDLDRLKICAAEDCADVVVDLSRNKSKRFCATGNCGNRTNVAAYRARKRAGATH